MRFSIRAERCIFFLLAGMIIASLFSGCDYARMRDDEALDYYDLKFSDMPKDLVPLGGGTEPVFAEKPEQIRSPLNPVPAVIEEGKIAYTYFCIQCHGPGGEGYGTVGQSFAPLPTNLKSDYVRQQADGVLFEKIGKGYKRHPPLAYTVSINDRWAVVLYIRSLADQPS